MDTIKQKTKELIKSKTDLVKELKANGNLLRAFQVFEELKMLEKRLINIVEFEKFKAGKSIKVKFNEGISIRPPEKVVVEKVEVVEPVVVEPIIEPVVVEPVVESVVVKKVVKKVTPKAKTTPKKK